MRILQRSTRRSPRAVMATVLGLGVIMAAAAGPARSATGRPAATVEGRPCADLGGIGAAGVIRRAEECSHAAGSWNVPATTAAPAGGGGQEQAQGQHQNPGPRALPGRKVCGPPYVHRDPRLGPVFLPRTGYLGTLLFGYNRYGNLTPSQFLAKYWDPSKNPPDWDYPKNDGFARNSQGQLLRFRMTLYPGQYIDRFGNEQGTFLATGGSSFISRAIAPNTLNTSPDDPAHLCDYHLYRVLTAFDVDGGPAAAWFEQPGGGLQYKLIPGYLPNPQFPLIPWLVRNGYLQRVY